MLIKINLITYNNGYGLTNDTEIVRDILLKNYKNKIEIRICNFFDHSIPDAHINIFFEIIPNLLTYKANFNILIPNQEWFYRNWLPYLNKLDYIWCKTKHISTNTYNCLLLRGDIQVRARHMRGGGASTS